MADPNDDPKPDDLFSFSSEAELPVCPPRPSLVKTDEADALDCFAIESAISDRALRITPPPSALLDFAEESTIATEYGRAAVPAPNAAASVVPFPFLPEALPSQSRRREAPRWVLAAAASLVAAVGLSWFVLQRPSDPAQSVSLEVDATPLVAARQTWPMSMPVIVTGISRGPRAAVPESTPLVSVAAAVSAVAPVEVMDTHLVPSAPPALLADRQLAIDLAPAPVVPAPDARREEGLVAADATADIPRPYPVPPATTAADEYGVRRTLHSYEDAYERLNAAAAADVWPSVDQRALSRAFATLKSQGLEFQNCAINVDDGRATVYCRGTLQIVRKVGSSVPLTAAQQWVFRMRQQGSDWKIDEVSATQLPLAARRAGGQG